MGDEALPFMVDAAHHSMLVHAWGRVEQARLGCGAALLLLLLNAPRPPAPKEHHSQQHCAHHQTVVMGCYLLHIP